MPSRPLTLSERTAAGILSMLNGDKPFSPGDKLPNENELSRRLNVSRTTLREAIRMLISRQILEIRRGQGTFVTPRAAQEQPLTLDELSYARIDLQDLYEIRLMFEPQSAFYAAKRATPEELAAILRCGREEEALILAGRDRTEAEQAFHQAIAAATHNEFVERLVPVLHRAIRHGVLLSAAREELIRETVADHRMIMDFLEKRDPLGAETAMKLHIIHAMRGFGIDEP